MTILVTGAAGFIGFHVAKALLSRGDTVVGLDNLNDYYDVALKNARLAELTPHKGFRFRKVDLKDRAAIEQLFAEHTPRRVIHLAAQAGVRHSLVNPHRYIDANIVGFLHVLEGCRHHGVGHLLYASSSSVYGANTQLPFSVHQNVDHPVSLYAATKKANELMAHSYAHLYRLPVTGLRFFTIYGPWGRPDMAPFIFTKKILAGEPIDVFNQGKHQRDFTYIDDVIEAIVRAVDRTATSNPSWTSDNPDPATSNAPYRLYNLGDHTPVPLLDLIASIEKAVGKTAKTNLLPIQPGDVPATFADVAELKAAIEFEPKTPLDDGVRRFVAWYREFYGV
jgi:UDP-glucuronate 4-epimerase